MTLDETYGGTSGVASKGGTTVEGCLCGRGEGLKAKLLVMYNCLLLTERERENFLQNSAI